MRDEAGIQVVSETAVCPFLSVEDGDSTRRCLAKRDDPIQISPRYIDAYCLTALHETCSLFLRAAVLRETSDPGDGPRGEERRGIVRRIWKEHTSHELEPARAVPVPPQVEREPPVARPERTAPESLQVLSEADSGTLEVENVPIEPKLEERAERTVAREEPEPVAVEAEHQPVVAEREPEHEGSIPEPESQPEQAVSTAEPVASEAELEPIAPQSEVAPLAPAPAHEAVSAEAEPVIPETQYEPATGREPVPVVTEPERGPGRFAATTEPELELMVAEVRPVVLDVPSETIAPQEQREPMHPTVPVPTITSPVDRAAIRAQDLVISGTGGSNLTIQLLDWRVIVAHAVVQADGTWSIPLPQTDAGNHIYFARAIDGAGHSSAQSSLLTLTVVPPSPTKPVRSWKVPAAVAAVIVLTGLGFFVSQSRSGPTAQPSAPPVIVAPAPRYMWSFPLVSAGAASGEAASHVMLILFNPTSTQAHVWVRASSARGMRLWSVTVKRQVIRTVPLSAAVAGDAVSLLADRNIFASRLVEGGPAPRYAFGESRTGKRSPETMPMPEQQWRFSPLPAAPDVVILTMYNPNHVAVQATVQIVGTGVRLRAHVAARTSEEISLSLRARTNAFKALLVTATGAIIPERLTLGPSGAWSSYGTPASRVAHVHALPLFPRLLPLSPGRTYSVHGRDRVAFCWTSAQRPARVDLLINGNLQHINTTRTWTTAWTPNSSHCLWQALQPKKWYSWQLGASAPGYRPVWSPWRVTWVAGAARHRKGRRGVSPLRQATPAQPVQPQPVAPAPVQLHPVAPAPVQPQPVQPLPAPTSPVVACPNPPFCR